MAQMSVSYRLMCETKKPQKERENRKKLKNICDSPARIIRYGIESNVNYIQIRPCFSATLNCYANKFAGSQ